MKKKHDCYLWVCIEEESEEDAVTVAEMIIESILLQEPTVESAAIYRVEERKC